MLLTAWTIISNQKLVQCQQQQQQQQPSSTTPSSSATLSYNLTEKQLSGTIVGNIAGDAVPNLPTAIAAGRFVLLNSSHPNQQYFAIDSAGLLRTSGVVNRDVICAKQQNCYVQLDVVFQPNNPPSSNFRLIRVQVFERTYLLFVNFG